MITIEDIIQGIMDILAERIASTDKVGKISNFIHSCEECLVMDGKRDTK